MFFKNIFPRQRFLDLPLKDIPAGILGRGFFERMLKFFVPAPLYLVQERTNPTLSGIFMGLPQSINPGVLKNEIARNFPERYEQEVMLTILGEFIG